MIPWKLWASAEIELWEAVALVLEIDPRSLVPLSTAWMAGPGRGPFFEPRSFASKAKYEDFDTALSFAERAANVSGPIYLRTRLAVGMNKRTALVTLAEVVAYFVSVDWPGIPAPLLALVSVSGRTEPPEPERPQAAAEPAPVSVATSSAGHSLKRRADPLAAVLAEAKRQALDPADWQSVWAALVKLAESVSRPAPLVGYVEGEGVQYRTDDAAKPVDYLSREAFRKRSSRS